MTYGEIITEAATSYLRRASADDQVRAAVRLVHRDLQRPLYDNNDKLLHDGNWRCMETHVSNLAYTTALVDGVAVPADYKAARKVSLVGTDGGLTPIDPGAEGQADLLRREVLQVYGENLSSDQTLQRWFEVEMKILLLFPVAATLRLDYYKLLALPADDDAEDPFDDHTDWFSEQAPDLLVLGACALGSVMLWQDQRAPMFNSAYLGARLRAAREDSRSKQAGLVKSYSPPLPSAYRRLR